MLWLLETTLIWVLRLYEGKGKVMRHVKFYSLEDVDEARVTKLLRLVAEKSVGC
jgi:hypothetical protein